MIIPITDTGQARQIFAAGRYPDEWPDDMQASGEWHCILGVYVPELVGCFPLNFWLDSVEIHVAFHPHFRGEFAVKSAQEAFRWVWDNTNYHTIIAEIEDPHVARYAERCGMRKVGDHYEVRKWAIL